MKPFVKNLDKKLELIAKKRRKQLLQLAERHKHSEEYWLERAKNPLKDILSLNWGPKRGTFKSTSGQLEFNPNTGIATSYQWYQIAAVLKGKLVLNTYRYSVTTSKHVGELRSLFRALNLKYVSIEAPNGLQNLDIATGTQVELYANAMVKNKYARVKYSRSVKDAEKALQLCKTLGGKYTQKQIKAELVFFEKLRMEKLEKQRQNRVRFVDNATYQDNVKLGMHITRDPDTYIGKYAKQELKHLALSQKLNRIYIHRSEGTEAVQSKILSGIKKFVVIEGGGTQVH